MKSGDGDEPLLGDYRRDGSRLIFTPRFPPSAGVTLHASLKVNGATRTLDVALPSPVLASTTIVEAIEPAAKAWPANTLRMYVTFSGPMRVGDAYAHIRILDRDGQAIEQPFVEIEPELWDPTSRRLTLLFDPGRIKRGLVDNEASGPPLMPGRDVTLVVDPSWRDASGAPLRQEHRRAIRVAAAERRPLSVDAWTLVPPTGARGPLTVRFHRPMDHALALRAITVRRQGELLAGRASLSDGDGVFIFTPDAPWSAGPHELAIDGAIEDVAGNRLGKAFDVDLSDPDASNTAVASARLIFTPKP